MIEKGVSNFGNRCYEHEGKLRLGSKIQKMGGNHGRKIAAAAELYFGTR
jgi:hypothetical protein